MSRALFALILLVLMGLPAQAQSRDLGWILDRLAAAEQPLFEALQYLRMDNDAFAAPALSRLQAALDGLPDTAEGWPAPWTEQTAAATAAQVVALRAAAAQAAASLAAGRLGDAHDLLVPLRPEISGLRTQVGFYLYPDCLMDLSRAMDALWVYRHDSPDYQDPEVRQTIHAQTAIFGYIAQKCSNLPDAPWESAQGDQMLRLYQLLRDGVARVYPAVAQGDDALFINTIRELKSLDRMLWLTAYPAR